MVDERELVWLLYRADWKRLSLTAEFSGQAGMQRVSGRLLVAPGGRYRFDGQEPESRPWPVDPYELLRPVRLLDYALSLRGPAVVAGRDGYDVVATHGQWRSTRGPDRIEVVVDAETGILLRSEQIFEGQTRRLAEFTQVSFRAEVDAGEFGSDSPGDRDEDCDPGDPGFNPFGGPGWRAAKTAANAAACVLGTAVRRSPGGEPETGDASSGKPGADAEAEMPGGEPFGDGAAAVIGDELVYAIYRGRGVSFSGQLHQWTDMRAVTGELRSSADRHHWNGVGSFLGAVSDRIGTMHRVWRVKTGDGGKYRIDYVMHAGKLTDPTAVACDGQQRWREYENRITVGPAGPADWEIATMIDASWLLPCELSEVTEVTFGGRRAFAMRVRQGEGPWVLPLLYSDTRVVVDAELGILLLFVSKVDGKPVLRAEFRDVVSAAVAAGSGEDDWDDAFRLDVPPGFRVIRHDGGVLNEIDVPEPVRAAARAAGSGIAAAKGFFDSLRGPRPPG